MVWPLAVTLVMPYGVTFTPLFATLAMPSAKRIKGPYNTLGAVPTNYIIDRGGRVRYAQAAAFDLDDLNRLLVPLLKETPPPEATGS